MKYARMMPRDLQPSIASENDSNKVTGSRPQVVARLGACSVGVAMFVAFTSTQGWMPERTVGRGWDEIPLLRQLAEVAQLEQHTRVHILLCGGDEPNGHITRVETHMHQAASVQLSETPGQLNGDDEMLSSLQNGTKATKQRQHAHWPQRSTRFTDNGYTMHDQRLSRLYL